MSEKSIERYGLTGEWGRSSEGKWIRYDGHLAALGEAEKERDDWSGEAIAQREARSREAFEAIKDRVTDELDKQAGASGAMAVCVALAAASDDRASVMTKRAEAAEQSLQTLRLSLEAEVERLRSIAKYHFGSSDRAPLGSLAAAEYSARGVEVLDNADRLQQLLDQPSETAGES